MVARQTFAVQIPEAEMLECASAEQVAAPALQLLPSA
jgi:hypothetical protein